MEEKQTIKTRVIRYMVYFLGIILVCTILSRTIYDYLLPVVSVTSITSGMVEVSQYATGKIGLDEAELKHHQATIISPMAGTVADFTKVEGDFVEKGEALGYVQQRVDLKQAHDEAVEQAQLSQEVAQSNRLKQQKQEKIIMLENECTKNQEKLKHLETDAQIVELKQEIDIQKKIMEDNKTLYEAGVISENEQETARLKWEQLSRSLEEKRKELEEKLEEEIEKNQEEIKGLEEEIVQLGEKCTLNSKKMEKVEVKTKEVITSPITGYIQTIQVANGAYVEQNEKLMIIVPEGSGYSLSFELSEEAANKIAVGQKARFSWAQCPYEAKILKKGFNLETGNAVISCEVEQSILDQMNLDYKTYRMVGVQISNQSQEYPMVVNNGAIQKANSQYFIYGVEEKEQLGRTVYTVRKIPIQLLEEGDYTTAISGNINLEMKVVNNYLSELEDGQEVVLE